MNTMMRCSLGSTLYQTPYAPRHPQVPKSPDRGAAIREFWNKYFEAAGTRVSPDNYRNMISDPGEVACPTLN